MKRKATVFKLLISTALFGAILISNLGEIIDGGIIAFDINYPW
ncbi:hypothetical protein [Paenibacillus assamensis]|nr:hypothetical protein [Paenibacillus assamensis]